MKNFVLYFCIFFLSFIYLYLLSPPDIQFGDPAELSTGAYLLSFVHSTGYPLYLLLGKTFITILSPLFSPFISMTIFSIFTSSLTIVLLYILLQKLGLNIIPSFLTIISFLISYEFTIQSTIPEVYPLLLFFIFLSLLIYIGRNICFLVFITGLGISHHLLYVIVFIPFWIIYFFQWVKRLRNKHIFLAIICFLISLTVYLYIPIRSAGDVTILDWPCVSNIKEFFDYISGSHFRSEKGYLQLIPMKVKIIKIISDIIFQFFLLCLVIPSGIIFLIEKNKPFFYSSLFSILFIILTAIFYKIPDFDVYLLPAYLLLSIYAGCGLHRLFNKLSKNISLIICVLVICFQFFFYKFSGTHLSRSHSYLAFDYLQTINRNLPENSVILSSWHYATALWYNKYVLKNRDDINIIMRANLFNDSWLNEIQKLSTYDNTYLVFPHSDISKIYPLVQDNLLWKISKDTELTTFSQIERCLFNDLNDTVSFYIDIPDKIKPRTVYHFDLYFYLKKAQETKFGLALVLFDKSENILFYNLFSPLYEHFCLNKLKTHTIYKERIFFYIPRLTQTNAYYFKISYIPFFDRLRDDKDIWYNYFYKGKKLDANFL
ncbi:MAG: DUF2723 domain-containing protein [Candidatus Hydrogenedentota bacterium]